MYVERIQLHKRVLRLNLRGTTKENIGYMRLFILLTHNLYPM